MKYLIIGAGGTGGSIAAYMTRAGKDVTLIARGLQLTAIEQKGIQIKSADSGNFHVPMIKVRSMSHYHDKADVIFICVKSYSMQDVLPFIREHSHDKTVIIPLQSVYGTGMHLQKSLSSQLVADGCIYISAHVQSPGVIFRHGNIFRILFGIHGQKQTPAVLEKIADDLCESHIDASVSKNIQLDVLEKFSYASAHAACGLYYGVPAGAIQKEGEARTMFISLIQELSHLSKVMGLSLPEQIVDKNLKLLDSLSPSAFSSMQKDIENGRPSEIDGLIYAVSRLGGIYGVPTPTYDKVMKKIWTYGSQQLTAASVS